MKRLTVISEFVDLEEGITRKPGDSFVCEDKRAEALVSYRLVTAEDIPEPKPKKARKKG